MLVGGGRAPRPAGSRSCGWSARSAAGSSASRASARRWWSRRRRRRRCCRSSPVWLRRPGPCWPTAPASSTPACCARRSSARGLDWPAPPVLCTVSLARRFAPLARKSLARPARRGSLGIEVDQVHRALPDAETCARVFCALFPRLCANAPTVGDAQALLSPRRRRIVSASRRGAPHPGVRNSLPLDTARRPRRVCVPRRAGDAALRRQVDLPAHPRPLPLLRPGGLDRARGDRRLPAHQLGARRPRAREPADQEVAPGRQPQAQAKRRLRLPPLPPRHPLPRAGGRPRARGRPRRQRGAPARPDPGRRSWPTSSPSLFKLRHCGRKLHLRGATRPPTDRWAAAALPASAISTPTPTAARSTRPSGCSTGWTPAPACWTRWTLASATHPPRRRYERAAALLRRARPAGLAARTARGRAPGHPHRAPTGARAAPRQGALRRLLGRARPGGGVGAAAGADRAGRAHHRPCSGGSGEERRVVPVPPDEVDEVRIVSTWVAANEPLSLSLEDQPSAGDLADWVSEASERGALAAVE